MVLREKLAKNIELKIVTVICLKIEVEHFMFNVVSGYADLALPLSRVVRVLPSAKEVAELTLLCFHGGWP